jgi:hypothetical protein
MALGEELLVDDSAVMLGDSVAFLLVARVIGKCDELGVSRRCEKTGAQEYGSSKASACHHGPSPAGAASKKRYMKSPSKGSLQRYLIY